MTTTHPMLTVGERLSIARTRADMKVGTMAQALGRHRNMVTAYESTDDPPMWVIRRYVEVLGNDTSVEWLTAEVGEAPRDLRPGTRAPRVRTGSNQPALFQMRGGRGRWSYEPWTNADSSSEQEAA